MDANETLSLIKEAEPYTLISGRLYRRGNDEALCLCANPKNYEAIILDEHVSIGNIHACANMTKQRKVSYLHKSFFRR